MRYHTSAILRRYLKESALGDATENFIIFWTKNIKT